MGNQTIHIYQSCPIHKVNFVPVKGIAINFSCIECGDASKDVETIFECQTKCGQFICINCVNKYKFIGYHGDRKNSVDVKGMQGSGQLGTGIYTSTDKEFVVRYAKHIDFKIFQVYTTVINYQKKWIDTTSKNSQFYWDTMVQGNNKNLDAKGPKVFAYEDKFFYQFVDTKGPFQQTKVNPNFYQYLVRKQIANPAHK